MYSIVAIAHTNVSERALVTQADRTLSGQINLDLYLET